MVNNLLDNKACLKLGCWNVKGLISKEHDKTDDILFLNELKDYDIIGLTETHTVQGKNNETPIAGYETCYFHRPKNVRAPHGSGGINVLIKPNLRKAVKLFPSQNNDYVWLHLDKNLLGLKQKLYICIAYIPPPDSSYSQKLQYDILDQVENDIRKLKTSGEILILGDLNARTGNSADYIQNDTSNYLPLDDEYTLDINISPRNSQDTITDERGKHLLELCIGSQLRILNGRTIGDSCGYYTSHQYNGSSTVDYGISSSTMLRDIVYFKIHPFIGTISDHCMTSLAIRTNRVTNPTKTTKLTKMPQFYKWNNNSGDTFKSALSLPPVQKLIDETNTLLNQTTNNTTINNIVAKFTSILNMAAYLSLKLKRKKQKTDNNKPWHTSNLKRMERDVNKKAREMARLQTGEARRKYFLCLKKYRKERKYAKRHHIKSQLEDLQNLKHNDPRRFWHALQNLREGTPKIDHSSKIPPGEWYDYLTTNNKNPHPPNNSLEEKITENLRHKNFTELDFSLKFPEVQKAISKLNNNKAIGLDKISNEMLKNCNAETLNCLTKMLNKIYLSETYPNLWCQGYISNIHKKGSYFEPQNYRNITITSSLGKLFNLILNTRLQTYIKNHNLLSPEQIGFEQNSSTTDHIFTLQTIIDKYTSTKSGKLYTCFIDYKTAFDKIWHQGLLFKLTNLGINNNFFNMIKSMYSKIDLRIKLGDNLTDTFASDIGVRQGDNLSPSLFNIYIDDLQKHIKEKSNTDPVTIGNYSLNSLFYADDIVLVSRTKKGLQNCIDALKDYSDTWRLQVNMDKTKTLIFNNKEPLNNEIFWYGPQQIQATETYTYLGIDFNSSGTLSPAITSLYKKGLKALYKLQQIIDNNTNIKTTLHIFDHTIKPILLYGSEVWGINLIKNRNLNNITRIIKDIENNKINQLEIKFYKQLLGVKRNTSTIGVRGELGRHPLCINALSNSIKYLHTINSKPENKLVIQALAESKLLSQKQNTWYKRTAHLEHLLDCTMKINSPNKHQIKRHNKTIIQRIKSEYETQWHQQLNAIVHAVDVLDCPSDAITQSAHVDTYTWHSEVNQTVHDAHQPMVQSMLSCVY